MIYAHYVSALSSTINHLAPLKIHTEPNTLHVCQFAELFNFNHTVYVYRWYSVVLYTYRIHIGRKKCIMSTK